MSTIAISEYIVADPQVCHGKPTFKGTRVMVWQVLDMLAAGQSVKETLQAFPHLTVDHIQSALSYAGSLTKESYVLVNLHPSLSA